MHVTFPNVEIYVHICCVVVDTCTCVRLSTTFTILSILVTEPGIKVQPWLLRLRERTTSNYKKTPYELNNVASMYKSLADMYVANIKNINKNTPPKTNGMHTPHTWLDKISQNSFKRICYSHVLGCLASARINNRLWGEASRHWRELYRPERGRLPLANPLSYHQYTSPVYHTPHHQIGGLHSFT